MLWLSLPFCLWENKVYLTDDTAAWPPTWWCTCIQSRQNPSSLWQEYNLSGQAAILLSKMLQCKAFGYFNTQGEEKKSFFHFPNPQKSVEDYKTCKAWLENLKNARLPRKVEDYKWKISHHLCEDHFMSGCFKDAFGRSVTSSLNFAG